MAQSWPSTTHNSFFVRIQENDPTSWQAFVNKYGTPIALWCARWKLQEADLHDVTQQILVDLFEGLKNFDYDSTKSFRGWLWKVTKNACLKFIEQQKKKRMNATAALHELMTIEAKKELQEYLAKIFDLEIFEIAKHRVQSRVEPHNWTAFHCLALEDLSGAETVQKVKETCGKDMQITMAYVAKRRVTKMLQAEIRQLNVDEDE